MKDVIEESDFQVKLRDGSATFLFDGEGNFVNLKDRTIVSSTSPRL